MKEKLSGSAVDVANLLGVDRDSAKPASDSENSYAMHISHPLDERSNQRERERDLTEGRKFSRERSREHSRRTHRPNQQSALSEWAAAAVSWELLNA